MLVNVGKKAVSLQYGFNTMAGSGSFSLISHFLIIFSLISQIFFISQVFLDDFSLISCLPSYFSLLSCLPSSYASHFSVIKTHGSESQGQERAKRIAKNKMRDELL